MMRERFGFLADYLIEYLPSCTCGVGIGMSTHDQYCGIEPVMTLAELAAIVDAPVVCSSPGQWRSVEDSEVDFSVYVSTQDNSIKVSVSDGCFSPAVARSYAVALLQAAFYAAHEESKA